MAPLASRDRQILALQTTYRFITTTVVLGKIDDLESAIEPFSEAYARFPQLVKALSELRTYIMNNRHVIPNYGKRYRHGEAIATGFVESTVNEVVGRVPDRCG